MMMKRDAESFKRIIMYFAIFLNSESLEVDNIQSKGI